METTSKAIETLNDLIEINNDPLAGFEKASEDLKEENCDLKALFARMAAESRASVTGLTSLVNEHDADPDETGKSASGAIRRAWIDVWATFGGSDRKSILEECERGEDAIKKACRSAMEPDGELSTEDAGVVRKQQTDIIASHNKIKLLRDGL